MYLRLCVYIVSIYILLNLFVKKIPNCSKDFEADFTDVSSMSPLSIEGFL